MSFVGNALKNAKSKVTFAGHKPVLKAVPAVEVPPPNLIPLILKHLEGPIPGRDYNVLHASDVTKEGFCPRRWALMHEHKVKPPDEWVDQALKVTFDVGRVIAALCTDKWLRDHAVGAWRCKRCGFTHAFGPYPGKKPCMIPIPSGSELEVIPTGLNCDWTYVEEKFTHSEYEVSGSLDLLLDVGMPKLRVVELKILNKDDFDDLQGPMAEHRVRTAMYLNLIENSQNPHRHKIDTSIATVMYVSRAYGKKHPDYNKILPFKEYVIKRDDVVLNPYYEMAAQVRTYRTTGKMPKRPEMCNASFCKMANNCPMQSKCWSGQ